MSSSLNQAQEAAGIEGSPTISRSFLLIMHPFLSLSSGNQIHFMNAWLGTMMRRQLVCVCVRGGRGRGTGDGGAWGVTI